MIVILLFTMLAAMSDASVGETEVEQVIINRALRCEHIRPSSWPDGKPPRSYLLTLLRIEAQYDVPAELKGLILAQACNESGFNPKVTGDIRDGRPKALGIFQQWPWMSKKRYGYNIDRTDPVQAAHAQMQHWKSQLPKAARHCGKTSKTKQWIVAQVRSVRAPPRKCLSRARSDGEVTRLERARCERCYQISKHYKRYRRWRRSWSRR